MTFLPSTSDMNKGLVPVRPEEIVCPTRVVFRYKVNKFLTSRVFPTAERAYAFAAEQEDVIVVQDARERPPQQDGPVNRAFDQPWANWAQRQWAKQRKERKGSR